MHAHRLNAYELAPAGMKALVAVETYLHQTTLGPQLIELVKMRASQINGCAYCLDAHSKALRKGGETEQRIYLLDACAALHTARAGGARLDRSADSDRRDPSNGRDL